MTKAVWGSVLTAAAVLLFSNPVYAQATDTANVTVSATVSA